MAAGIGGVLMFGAGLTLLLAILRLSDGSLLLSGPPRINILSGTQESANTAHHLQNHQYRQQRRSEQNKISAAERWIIYESGNGNGVVELEGLPPPPPGYTTERRRSHEKMSPSGLPPPWRKRDHKEPHAAEDGGGGNGPPEIPQNLATQFMTRSPRGNRQYDVPQIAVIKKSVI